MTHPAHAVARQSCYHGPLLELLSAHDCNGTPTRYEPEMCEQAHNYCLLGATNDELAEFFHVSPSTIDRWIAGRADFGDAVRQGRVVADARMARSLYDRAVGYDRE